MSKLKKYVKLARNIVNSLKKWVNILDKGLSALEYALAC